MDRDLYLLSSILVDYPRIDEGVRHINHVQDQQYCAHFLVEHPFVHNQWSDEEDDDWHQNKDVKEELTSHPVESGILLESEYHEQSFDPEQRAE